jgi:Fe-Mn family superoxide dismutase
MSIRLRAQCAGFRSKSVAANRQSNSFYFGQRPHQHAGKSNAFSRESPMPISLPPLPYDYDALAPIVSGATVRVHYDRHHRGYVEKLNALIRGTDYAHEPLERIVERSAVRGASDPVAAAIFNNAAQAWNHAFYWSSLRPKGGGGPRGTLAARIAADFGSARAFAETFAAAATNHFGSGWAWLVLERGALRVVTTSNAGTPIVDGLKPLLVIDVWEHAYYLDYQQRRADYVANVVDNLLDWDFAEQNFGRARDAAPAAYA